jgi:hypothetical protein
MKKYRSLLKATVLQESRNRRTSNEIAKIFQKRHARAIVPVMQSLVTAKIVKDIDDVRNVSRNSVDPRQGELFEERIKEIVSFPVMRDGKKVRTERRALAILTFEELTQLIDYRRVRPPRQSKPLEDYISLHDEIEPYAPSGETTVETAYRSMRKAQKRA